MIKSFFRFLSWAEAVGSTAFGNIGGVGVSSIMHQGTWVWIMLMNDDPNIPAHSGVVVAFDRQVLVNGKNIACIGDAESCGGVIVSGSSDVKVG